MYSSFRLTMVLVLTVATATGCRSAGARYRRDVDTVISAAKQSSKRYAEASPLPLEPGLWAIYSVRTGKMPGYVRLWIVGSSPCGVWVEFVNVSYAARRAVRMCLKSLPPRAADISTEIVRIVELQENDGARRIVSLKDVNRTVGSFLVATGAPAAGVSDGDPVAEDVNVTAGLFVGAKRFTRGGTRTWTHDSAPFYRVLRIEGPDVHVELLAFGSGRAFDSPRDQ